MTIKFSFETTFTLTFKKIYIRKCSSVIRGGSPSIRFHQIAATRGLHCNRHDKGEASAALPWTISDAFKNPHQLNLCLFYISFFDSSVDILCIFGGAAATSTDNLDRSLSRSLFVSLHLATEAGGLLCGRH